MKQSYKEAFKYGMVGVIGLGIEWISYFLLRDLLGISYILSHIIGSVLAIANNFLLNSYFTFKATDKLKTRAISFFGIAGAGLVLSTILLPTLVATFNYILKHFEIMSINQKIVQDVAKLCSTIFVAALQFFLNKYFTFKKKETTTIV